MKRKTAFFKRVGRAIDIGRSIFNLRNIRFGSNSRISMGMVPMTTARRRQMNSLPSVYGNVGRYRRLKTRQLNGQIFISLYRCLDRSGKLRFRNCETTGEKNRNGCDCEKFRFHMDIISYISLKTSERVIQRRIHRAKTKYQKKRSRSPRHVASYCFITVG